jgi:hypothetical protein
MWEDMEKIRLDYLRSIQAEKLNISFNSSTQQVLQGPQDRATNLHHQ